mmetsp:Transcript_154193/g.284157  ORF Transcript_154193/g.284157 Transcript_154193/m.284157 type:complete len:131 (-) Transcript_154193:11-403(-)
MNSQICSLAAVKSRRLTRLKALLKHLARLKQLWVVVWLSTRWGLQALQEVQNAGFHFRVSGKRSREMWQNYSADRKLAMCDCKVVHKAAGGCYEEINTTSRAQQSRIELMYGKHGIMKQCLMNRRLHVSN